MGLLVVFGVVLLLSTCLCAVPNQFGREFIVVFTEHIQDYSTLELFLSTEEPTPVSVTISAPLEPETQAAITATVNQGESTRVTLSKLINLKFSAVYNRGISVVSSGDICVQGFTNSEYSKYISVGAFIAYPVNSFAKEYIVVACCEDNSCEIAVVSSVDETNVTVYLQISNNKKVAFSGNDFYDGDTINITLNRYQAVQLQSTGDLSGSRVIASEPVGVFIGTDLTRIGSRGVGDFLGEQLLPSHVMGMDYFLMPFPDRTVGDVIKIVAEFANTKITFQEEDYIIAHAGGTLKLTLPSSSPSALMSNKRIVVAQVSQSFLSSEQNDTDPSMMIVPPKEQWLQKYVFASPQLSSEFNPVKMAIFAESTCKNDVILDTTIPTLTWSDVGDVAVTYVTLTNTAHTLRVNTSCGSVWGYLYGTSYEKAWSMPIGWNMITLPEARTTTSNSTHTTTASTTRLTTSTAITIPATTTISPTTTSTIPSTTTTIPTITTTIPTTTTSVLTTTTTIPTTTTTVATTTSSTATVPLTTTSTLTTSDVTTSTSTTSTAIIIPTTTTITPNTTSTIPTTTTPTTTAIMPTTTTKTPTTTTIIPSTTTTIPTITTTIPTTTTSVLTTTTTIPPTTKTVATTTSSTATVPLSTASTTSTLTTSDVTTSTSTTSTAITIPTTTTITPNTTSIIPTTTTPTTTAIMPTTTTKTPTTTTVIPTTTTTVATTTSSATTVPQTTTFTTSTHTTSDVTTSISTTSTAITIPTTTTITPNTTSTIPTTTTPTTTATMPTTWTKTPSTTTTIPATTTTTPDTTTIIPTTTTTVASTTSSTTTVPLTTTSTTSTLTTSDVTTSTPTTTSSLTATPTTTHTGTATTTTPATPSTTMLPSSPTTATTATSVTSTLHPTNTASTSTAIQTAASTLSAASDASTSTTLTVPSPASIPSMQALSCICVCKTNSTNTQLTRILNDIKKKLLLPKQSLSSTVRKLTSSSDSRPSAAVFGTLGVLLITITIVALVAPDAIAVLSFFSQKMTA
ncbi:mucin-5AC-like [Haliotis rufescens]|uniref:mucin-5AC-like n=1 Tax=Haliotis rufescens TaxID=6454 RepID=UPI00201EECCA|nr:mucin-5AC-like [Haliotis rufescens]